MLFKKNDKQKKEADTEVQFLSSGGFGPQAEEFISAKNKDTGFAICSLRKMKINEIIVKTISVTWALIWSATSLFCLFSEEYKLLMPVTALPAAGFWFILARSAGSVGVINTEIRELKKKAEKESDNGTKSRWRGGSN